MQVLCAAWKFGGSTASTTSPYMLLYNNSECVIPHTCTGLQVDRTAVYDVCNYVSVWLCV